MDRVAFQDGVVSGLDGEYLVQIPLVGQFVVHRHKACDAVLAQGVQLFGGQDAGFINLRQFPLHVAEIISRQYLFQPVLIVGL